MKIDKTPESIKIENLVHLYSECFSKGLSEQYIDLNELRLYLKRFLECGKIISIVDQTNLVGALLAIPIGFDNDFPAELKTEFYGRNVWYIAEI